MLRIRRVTPLDDYRVRLTLTNGDVVERDLDALIWGPVFEPLRRDYALFRAASVEAGTVVWPGDLDFDPNVLIWGGPAPSDPARKPPRFLRLASEPRQIEARA
jgi:hypothetical protein